MNRINISIELQDQFLRDVLSTACWYGSAYWASFENAELKHNGHYEDIISITILEKGGEEEIQSTHHINLVKIARGIERLIGREFNSEESHAQCAVSYSAAMLKAAVTNDGGEVDAELADLVLQLACFGHIIYG